MKKVTGKIYSISKSPYTVWNLLYRAYILPNLDYCGIVWTPTNAYKTSKKTSLYKYVSSNTLGGLPEETVNDTVSLLLC